MIALPRPPAALDACPRVRILGIDPGLLRTGYAILDAPPPPAPATLVEAGVIRLHPKQPVESRLIELETALQRIIEERRPHVMACEELFAHYKHPRTAILMGHARGVALLVGARNQLELLHLASTNVKKLMTGNGHAGKHQVQRAVALALGLPRLAGPHDVSDAAALALCGARLHDARRRVAAAGGRA